MNATPITYAQTVASQTARVQSSPKAGKTYKTLEAAAKKLGAANGYVGRAGGWIFKGERSVMQGWWNLGTTWMRRGIISGDWKTGYSINAEAAAAYFANPLAGF